MQLSLAHLSILDASHADLVSIAADLGCQRICTFLKGPHGPPDSIPHVGSPAAAKELRKRMDDAGLQPGTTEAYVMRAEIDPTSYEPTLELAALLGAERMTAINLHPDFNGAADQLSAFCDLAASHGLMVGLEWFKFSVTKTLPDALAMLNQVQKSNLALTVDSLHLMRNGGQPSDLTTVPPSLMPYAQINDGPLQLPENRQENEAVRNRGFPGEDEFPLVEFVRNLPDNTVLCVEVPTDRLRASLTPAQRAKRAVEGTRKVLAAAGRG